MCMNLTLDIYRIDIVYEVILTTNPLQNITVKSNLSQQKEDVETCWLFFLFPCILFGFYFQNPILHRIVVRCDLRIFGSIRFCYRSCCHKLRIVIQCLNGVLEGVFINLTNVIQGYFITGIAFVADFQVFNFFSRIR